MTFYIKPLDENGNFELLDGELSALYPDVDFDQLTALTEAQYQELCAKRNELTRFIDGELVYQTAQLGIDEKALLSQRKVILINTIAAKLDQLQTEALVGYSQTEKDSFYRQEKEALAWQADNQADCPMLRQIAENRGVPFEILAQKVLEKSALFAQAQGALIGQKQAFEDRAERAETLEELNQIETEVGEWTM